MSDYMRCPKCLDDCMDSDTYRCCQCGDFELVPVNRRSPAVVTDAQVERMVEAKNKAVHDYLFKHHNARTMRIIIEEERIGMRAALAVLGDGKP